MTIEPKLMSAEELAQLRSKITGCLSGTAAGRLLAHIAAQDLVIDRLRNDLSEVDRVMTNVLDGGHPVVVPDAQTRGEFVQWLDDNLVLAREHEDELESERDSWRSMYEASEEVNAKLLIARDRLQARVNDLERTP